MTERFDTEVTTTCGYCGVGCRLEAHAHDGRVVSITAAQRWTSQQRPHVPQGPLRPPVLPLAGAADDATHPRRERRPAAGDMGRGDDAHRLRVEPDQGRARPGRDRRPRVVPRDERGLLRPLAPDTCGDRHEQHRQLLARLPLADLVGPAQVAWPLGRHRLLRRHRGRGRGDHHRREPDRGPPGRRRADQAGDAARAASW